LIKDTKVNRPGIVVFSQNIESPTIPGQFNVWDGYQFATVGLGGNAIEIREQLLNIIGAD